MRREPDVGVEASLQHLEGVAAAREMMRDDERDETDRAGAGCPDSVTENAFENQGDDHGAPADKNGGRIKIRDRRALLEIHPRDQPERVDRERKEKEVERRAIQRARPS